jgi:hypothetical protein
MTGISISSATSSRSLKPSMSGMCTSLMTRSNWSPSFLDLSSSRAVSACDTAVTASHHKQKGRIYHPKRSIHPSSYHGPRLDRPKHRDTTLLLTVVIIVPQLHLEDLEADEVVVDGEHAQPGKEALQIDVHPCTIRANDQHRGGIIDPGRTDHRRGKIPQRRRQAMQTPS